MRLTNPTYTNPTYHFAAEFRGEVIQPGDSGYETARKIWNASIDKRPGIIARCSGVADVVAGKRQRERRFILGT
jgi:hypothetical protein